MSLPSKNEYLAACERSQQRFLASGSSPEALKERTALVDDLVRTAYASTLQKSIGGGLTLLAVGGYGRAELFPHSDIDLLVLVRRQMDAADDKAALSEFLKQLWDVGLRVSQSVRTVEDCCRVHEGNYELTVSLLDHRILAGDSSLFTVFEQRFARFLSAERSDLIRRLCRMARTRHARFNETIYHLEPDIKEMPGGLRDLQTIHWLSILRGQDAPEGVDPRSKEFLFSVRCFLHYTARRDSNLLSFEAQDEISAAAFSPWQDPARWMRAYYRHASAIFRHAQLELEEGESLDRGLLANFRDWRSRLSNSEFSVSRDRIFLRQPAMLEADAELPLRLFRFTARHGVPLARVTERRLVDHVFDYTRIYASQPPKASFWRDFLAQPHAVMALRSMASTGFLTAILPEWERIQHLVVRDFYHQYTVDEHTLVTLESLFELVKGDTKLAAIASESEHDLWLLKLALLLHDIGKGSGRDHSEEAVRLARAFLERSGLSEIETGTVLFLIEQHLALSAVLQARDLDDPATARFVASLTKTSERLRLLTLLTYADIAGVNPSAMTDWRAEQLWRLYRIGNRQLTTALSEQRVETAAAVYGEVTPAMKEFLDGLPQRYLWTHTRERAQAHTQLYVKARESGAAVDLIRRDGAYELSVATHDRPSLLASIAGAIASFGLDIVRAEAFSNSAGAAIDTFVFLDPARNLDLNPPELERLRLTIKRVVLGELQAAQLLKHRPIPKPPALSGAIQPSVSADNENASRTTIFEVVAQDRPGLLYSLASAISRHGGNIEVVIVNTEAHKAIDVFHVSRNGAKLTREDTAALIESLIAACEG